MDDKKIAVLIDAENVSGKYIKLILDEVSNYGSATYKRLYGDFQTPSVRAWMKNLRPVSMHQPEKCRRSKCRPEKWKRHTQALK